MPARTGRCFPAGPPVSKNRVVRLLIGGAGLARDGAIQQHLSSFTRAFVVQHSREGKNTSAIPALASGHLGKQTCPFPLQGRRPDQFQVQGHCGTKTDRSSCAERLFVPPNWPKFRPARSTPRRVCRRTRLARGKDASGPLIIGRTDANAKALWYITNPLQFPSLL